MLAISLGVVLGSWSSALLALYTIASRPYRRVRNRFVLALVKLPVPTFMIGATLLLFTTLQAMHVERQSVSDGAVIAFVLGYASGVIPSIWAEARWRKSAGIPNPRIVLSRSQK